MLGPPKISVIGSVESKLIKSINLILLIKCSPTCYIEKYMMAHNWRGAHLTLVKSAITRLNIFDSLNIFIFVTKFIRYFMVFGEYFSC